MPPSWIRGFMAVIAAGVFVGFGYMYGAAIIKVWASPDKKIEFPPEYVYVATALAGLVGGVAAMIFNEKLPDDPAARPAAPAGPPAAQPTTPSASGPAAAATAFVQAVIPGDGKNRLFAVVSSMYVIGYFLAGVAAIVTWVRVSENTADLVKNLALISIGLFVAIARSFFHVPQPQQG